MKPILFHIGSFPVYSFGVMVATGVLLSLIFLSKKAAKTQFVSSETAQDLVFVTVLSGFLGGRFLYVIENIRIYLRNPLQIFAIWEGGLIFYGGVVGSLLGIYLFCRIKKIDYLMALDFLIPFVALTHAFGRIGCLLNGCCHGKACDLPWAIYHEGLYQPVHPVQLYEAVFNFGLFFFLEFITRGQKFKGQILSLYFICYAMARFVLEFYRHGYTVGPLTHNQWISIVLILAGGLLYFFQCKKVNCERTVD